MVMPAMTDDACPQCGADVRAAGTRCQSCGFYLPARPAPRTGPVTARLAPQKDDSRKRAIAVLAVGGVVVVALLVTAAVISGRRASPAPSTAPLAAALPPPVSAAPPRVEPSALLSEARKRATAWRNDAVLVRLSVERVDAGGVADGSGVELVYSTPSAKKLTGGAETSAERLVLRARAGDWSTSEQRGPQGRVVPEPNCLFEDAWAAAQRASVDPSAGLRMSYAWSDRYDRPLWEVTNEGGDDVVKRVDGVSCSILTR